MSYIILLIIMPPAHATWFGPRYILFAHIPGIEIDIPHLLLQVGTYTNLTLLRLPRQRVMTSHIYMYGENEPWPMMAAVNTIKPQQGTPSLYQRTLEGKNNQ